MLSLVEQAGGEVTLLDTGNLRVATPEPLPSAVVAGLRCHKAAVVRLLGSRLKEAAAPKSATSQNRNAHGVVESALVRPRKPRADHDEDSLVAILKGRAIALYSDLVQQTLWLVADEEDVNRLAERRGVVYTAPEIREILKIKDPQIVAEIHRWKEIHNATIRSVEKPKS